MPDASSTSSAQQLESTTGERSSPSSIVSVGIVLLFLAGIVLGLRVVLDKPEQPLTCITFENVDWSEGAYLPGAVEFSFTDGRQTYQADICSPNVIVAGLPQEDACFTEGIRLVVKAITANGQTDSYGVVFCSLDSQNFLFFGINEVAETAAFGQVIDGWPALLDKPRHVGEILQEIPAGQPRLIKLEIMSEEVTAWLNSQPVRTSYGENLTDGGIGVFVKSGPQSECLPIRVKFWDFSACPLSLDHRP